MIPIFAALICILGFLTLTVHGKSKLDSLADSVTLFKKNSMDEEINHAFRWQEFEPAYWVINCEVAAHYVNRHYIEESLA